MTGIPAALLLLAAADCAFSAEDDEDEKDDTELAIEEDAEPETGSPQARIYRNPEERREAGLGRQLADWLKVSNLLETENEQFEEHYGNSIEINRGPGTTYAFQLGLDMSFSEAITAELVFESEREPGLGTHTRMDEGLISVELDPWGLEAGRLYVPFGEYYSHFTTGPLLEFGETRGDALVIDYTIADALEIAAYTFDSKTRLRPGQNAYDWGFNLDYANEDESIRLGAGYLSDLAESEEKLLEESDAFMQRQVAAWNAYALIGFYPFEVTFEYIGATADFAELDANADRPSAYNLEFAWFPAESMQFAFRREGSDEFSDAPEKQWGINWTWRPGNNFIFSADYLRGEYRPDFVLDDADNELQDSNAIALQLAIEF